MNELLFIDDFLLQQVVGGAELNNHELALLLSSGGWSVKHLQSHTITEKHIDDSDCIIVSNFIGLQAGDVDKIISSLKPYIIYEHDHKYLKTRNPAHYTNFTAPESDIINFEFYSNARAVVCQTQFHTNIVYNNLKLDNIINLGGNLWSEATLNMLLRMSSGEKEDRCSIMDSRIEHKNTYGAIQFCKAKEMPYDLITNRRPVDFLEKLSRNKRFVFFPKTPETLSRIVVEARMMNVSVVTNNLVGATKEPWFEKKGEQLVQHFFKERERIPRVIENAF